MDYVGDNDEMPYCVGDGGDGGEAGGERDLGLLLHQPQAHDV